MNEELKPVRCGCGGEAEIDWVLEPSNCYMANVYCNKCGTKTIPFWSTEKDKAIDYAVTTWNRAMGADQFREVTKKIERIENVQECAENARCNERTAKAEWSEVDGCHLCGECGFAVCPNCDVYCAGCGARLEWE